jgi:hypothetical protein
MKDTKLPHGPGPDGTFRSGENVSLRGPRAIQRRREPLGMVTPTEIALLLLVLVLLFGA